MNVISSVSVAVGSQCLLGEGPVWNNSINSLHFIDIFEKRVHTYDPITGELASFLCRQEIGAVIPAENGRLLLLLRGGIYSSNMSGSETILMVPLESDKPKNRMNDAKCDPNGRLWAGTMDADGVDESGALYRYDNRGLVKILDSVTVSNGLGWSPDGRKMYFIDSGKQMLQVADYELESGMLRNLKALVEFDRSLGIPDGLTVDADGGVWVAFFGGSSVKRFSPEGIMTHIVALPVSQVTSCCFGGSSLQRLYITTANVGLKENHKEEEYAGNLFVADTGFSGIASVPCQFLG